MTRPDLAAHARAELDTRADAYPDRIQAGVMSAGDAGRKLAAWRAVVGLLDHGQTTFEACLGAEPKHAWPALFAVVQEAVEHRAVKADQYPCDGSTERLVALKHVRSLIIRSAARQGALLHEREYPPKQRQLEAA